MWEATRQHTEQNGEKRVELPRAKMEKFAILDTVQTKIAEIRRKFRYCQGLVEKETSFLRLRA